MQFEKIILCNESFIKYSKLLKKDYLQDFQELWNLRPEKSNTIFIFNKEIEIPRKQQCYGKSYNFSGKEHVSLDIPPIIQYYIDLANEIDEDKTNLFNMALVNWYENGNEYIGYHSDDEKQLIKDSPIYCFSFGQERDFLLKDKITKKVTKIILENQSLVIMGGACQRTHKHSIPKRLKIKNPRISITLRKFY